MGLVMRKTSNIVKIISITALVFSSALLCACDDALNVFLMKKHISRTEKRIEQKQKKDSAADMVKMKPSFMFADDEKFFKNHMLLKEEYFLLDRYKYISASSVSNFLTDTDSNFIIYDKASAALLFFNKLGVLENRVRLNFGGESRILAPSNMQRDENGNIMMTCSILGRFYRFTPAGVLLNASEINENEGSVLKRMFAIKMFSNSKYNILAEFNSKKIFVYENDNKLFELKHEGMSDDSYIYFSPQNDIFLVDVASSSILNIIPESGASSKQSGKYSLKTYRGDKILKNSIGQIFIYKKNERVIEKLNLSGKVISSYGIIKDNNITFENNLFPCDFAIDTDDSLYILDDKNYKINVYSRSGVFSFSFGSYGKSAGRFVAPHKITVDRLKRIIVSDKDKNKALVFNSKGEYIENYGDILGTNLLEHYGLFADLHEKIHILDYISNQHYTINYNFQFLRILNDVFSKKTNYPQNFITLNSSAGINYFDLNAQRCYELLPEAKLKRLDIPAEISSIKIEPRKIFVKNITRDGSGNLLGLCKNENFVYKLDITGRTINKFKLPEKGEFYSAIAVDLFKNFYLISKRDNKILKFDEAGKPAGTFAFNDETLSKNETLSLLTFFKNNSAFACSLQQKKIVVFNTLNGFTVDSSHGLDRDGGRGAEVLDVTAAGENIFVLSSSGGNLMVLKYKLIDYFREGVSLFSRGLFQEALVMFEKHRRFDSRPGPNALFYMAQCYRKMSKNYEAALLEAEISKKYPDSHAAKRVE